MNHSPVRSPRLVGLVCFSVGTLTGAFGDSPMTGNAAQTGGMAVDRLVAQVLDGNPELAYYREEIEAARAGRRVAARWQNPELMVGVGNKRVEAFDGMLAGDGMAWSVSVAQTFEWPGRIGLRKAIANHDLELAEMGWERFRAALAARTRFLAQKVLVAQEQAAATREVATRLQALLAVVVQRDPAGVVPLLDRRILEATAIEVSRQAAAAQQELDTARVDLNQLRGAPPTSSIRIIPGAASLLPSVPPLETLLQTARTHNFDLRMRESELAQQGFRVDLSKKERYPNLTLAPFYAREEALDQEQMVGVSLSLPLPVFTQKAGDVTSAEARLRQAQAALQVTWREIERRITSQSLALGGKMDELRQWQPDTRDRFREAAELADRHYRLGAVPVTVYVEMQTRYLSALEALLATQSEALEHARELELLVGRPLSAFAPQPEP